MEYDGPKFVKQNQPEATEPNSEAEATEEPVTAEGETNAEAPAKPFNPNQKHKNPF